MKKINHLILKNFSNAVLLITAISLSQCCFGAIYQPSVDKDLKERAFRLAEEKRHIRRKMGGRVL